MYRTSYKRLKCRLWYLFLFAGLTGCDGITLSTITVQKAPVATTEPTASPSPSPAPVKVIEAPTFELQFAHTGGLANTFKVKGQAPTGSTVLLFEDAACATTPIAQASAADFAIGVAVPAKIGATQTVRAQAVAGDIKSVCSTTEAKYVNMAITWEYGSTIGPFTATYGTKGNTQPTNVVSGRSGGAIWEDDDHIWLFGGNGPTNWGDLGDLWKMNKTTKLWTWVGGTTTLTSPCPTGPTVFGTKGVAYPDATYSPRARAAVAYWQGKDRKFYVYGGYRSYCGALGDMWSYDPANGEWIWVSGPQLAQQAGSYGTKGTASPTNEPPARLSPTFWTDHEGRFWMFGGEIRTSAPTSGAGCANDMWMFDTDSQQWTWQHGEQWVHTITSRDAVYGTAGTYDDANVPRSTCSGNSWVDLDGNLWLYGGANGAQVLSELWKFDVARKRWMFVGGPTTANAQPVYGEQGVFGPAVWPGSARQSGTWIDSNGHFWMLGGASVDENAVAVRRADYWRYDPELGQWAWEGGSKEHNPFSVYTTIGTASYDNEIGGRKHPAVTSKNDRVWIFGGEGEVEALPLNVKSNNLWSIPKF